MIKAEINKNILNPPGRWTCKMGAPSSSFHSDLGIKLVLTYGAFAMGLSSWNGTTIAMTNTSTRSLKKKKSSSSIIHWHLTIFITWYFCFFFFFDTTKLFSLKEYGGNYYICFRWYFYVTIFKVASLVLGFLNNEIILSWLLWFCPWVSISWTLVRYEVLTLLKKELRVLSLACGLSIEWKSWLYILVWV